MITNIEFWHRRFEQQAQWTENIRSYIIQKFNIEPNCKVFEVGSGTGAVLNHIADDLDPKRYGIDINWKNLQYNKNSKPVNRLIHGNGFKLPLATNVFNITYCHYLLLWINDPIFILDEMKRVTQSGGWICLFAEPDYLSRIDSPDTLSLIGTIQNKSLSQQGVQLDTGRKLASWLVDIGLSNIYWGILGSHQPAQKKQNNEDIEWYTIQSDLEKIMDQKEIVHHKNLYIDACENGSKTQFVPTFYAYGQKE